MDTSHIVGGIIIGTLLLSYGVAYSVGGFEARKDHCEAVSHTQLYRVENGRIVCQVRADVTEIK